MCKSLVLAVLAVVLSAPAAAQIYKWVDGSGVTHYSEKPPENGKSKEVQLREASPASAKPKVGPDTTLQERERAFNQRQVAREQAEAKQAKESAVTEKWCKEARIALADMQRAPRMYELNDKGERVYVSDKVREDSIAAHQADYDQHCK